MQLLRYARFRLFRSLMAPFQRWTRARRMRLFLQLVRPESGASVLDLGGQPETWGHEALPALDITVLNLPGVVEQPPTTRQRLRLIEGDGCRVEMRDRSFAVVYSNSVIEHVGDAVKRAEFAREVSRLGGAYWVQTPSIWFPIEPHCGMPFWWFYPPSLRRAILTRWRRKLPAWTDMVEGATVVSKAELRRLFPDAQILTERVLGIPKSYIAVRAAAGEVAETDDEARLKPTH